MNKYLPALILASLLWGCASRNTPNTIQIGGGEASAVRLGDNGLFINRSLLGMEDTDVSIHTSSDNSITFDISRPEDAGADSAARGAF